MFEEGLGSRRRRGGNACAACSGSTCLYCLQRTGHPLPLHMHARPGAAASAGSRLAACTLVGSCMRSPSRATSCSTMEAATSSQPCAFGQGRPGRAAQWLVPAGKRSSAPPARCPLDRPPPPPACPPACRDASGPAFFQMTNTKVFLCMVGAVGWVAQRSSRAVCPARWQQRAGAGCSFIAAASQLRCCPLPADGPCPSFLPPLACRWATCRGGSASRLSATRPTTLVGGAGGSVGWGEGGLRGG